MRSIIYTIFICMTSAISTEKCEKEISNTFLIKDSVETGAVIIWFPANVGTHNTYDKCSHTTGQPLQRNCTKISGKAKWFEINSSNKYIDCKQIDSQCKEEEFEHYFQNEENKLEKYFNKWQTVKMGEIGYLQKPCYINAEYLLTRKCVFSESEYKAKWKITDDEKKNMICWPEINPLIARRQCKTTFLKTTLINDETESNVLLMWFPTNAGTQSKIRLCSNETGLPLQRHCAYNRLNNTAEWEEFNENIKLVNCSSIVKQCPAEPFHHTYIMKNNVIKSYNNKWKTVNMNERADLQEPCLQNDGLPITRRCEFNPQHLKAEWEVLLPEMRNISCLREIREEIITYDLNTLYEEVKENMEMDREQPTKVIEKMGELLGISKTVRVAADIKISSEILKIVTTDNKSPELLTEVLNVTDIIMTTDRRIVQTSEKINATTNLLNTVDNYIHNMAMVLVNTDHCQNSTYSIFYKTIEHSSVFYINPSCSNISGVAVYHKQHHYHRKQHYDRHTRNHYRFIYLNQSLEQITQEPDLRLATYFPLSLWNRLKISGSVNDQTILVFVIFPNDLLFVNRTEMEHKPSKNVLEIAIPNYTGDIPEDVPFILRYRTKRLKQLPKCGYWNYSTWITNGIKTEYKNISDNTYVICHTSHLSHFAAMFQTSSFPSLSFGESIILNISHDEMLDYISISGCGMSLLGLSCIWLTAMCFRNWRVQTSNKVLLNMSFVLTLIMLFFLLLNLPYLWKSYIDMKNPLHCMIMGIFLHYNILVLFSWMLIIAIMQYQRYVKVVGYNRSSNFIVKYAIASWGLPLIPAGVVAYLDPHTYMPDPERIASNTAICYPSGKSLYYGVLLPMSVIMLTNLAIFIYIFCSLRRSLGQFQQRNERKRMIIQIRISVLLFFLLGISWIFGLLSYLDNSPVFSYMFCLTSTLQGFVLFIYAIVIEKKTREHWLILCCAKSYKTMEDTNEMIVLSRRS